MQKMKKGYFHYMIETSPCPQKKKKTVYDIIVWMLDQTNK